jgi:hypothetical protein
MQPTLPNWIAELANRERERRADYKITREAIREFQTSFGDQVGYDIEAYFREFPSERGNIQRESEAGVYLITRTRDEGSIYTGLACQVRTSISVHEMLVECSFPHRPALDKKFRLIINPDGAVGVAECSVADLSRYMLTPVLFDKLNLNVDLPGTADAAGPA